MSDWEDAPDSVAISFPKNEAALAGFGALHPDDQAVEDARDQTPQNIRALEQEMRQPAYKDPKMADALAQLKAEHARLTKGKPASEWEDASDGWEDAADGWQDATKDNALVHAGKRITGGLAAAEDLIGGLGGALVGGLHGLGTLATGGSMDEAVKNIGDTSSKFMIGSQLKDPTVKASYDDAMALPHWLMEKSHDIAGRKMVFEKGDDGKMRAVWKDTSPVTGTIGDVGLQTIVPVLGMKGLGAISRGTIRTTPGLAERGSVIPETTGDTLVDRLTMEPERAGTRPTTSEVRPELNSDALPYEKAEIPLEAEPTQARPIHPDAAMRDITPEQAASIPEMDFYADKGRELGMQVDDLVMDKPRVEEPIKVTERPGDMAKAALEADSDNLFSDRNLAEVKKGKEIEEAYRQRDEQALAERGEAPPVRNRADEPLMEPSQGARPIEKITKPINSRSFGGKQRGAVNFGAFTKNKADMEALSKNSLYIDRAKETLKVGSMVRLMNGKQGTVTAISDGRYQIRGADFNDSVPLQGIDYAYKPAGFQASMPYGQTKVGAKQRGGPKQDFKFLGAGFRDVFSGEVFNTGPLHLRDALPDNVKNRPAGQLEAGFIGSDGQFYNRTDANRKINQGNQSLIKTNASGEIHSSNLFPREQMAGQTKAGKGQRGALNLGAFMREKKPLRDIKFDEATTEDLIRKALRQSDTPEEFARAIKMSVEDAAINRRASELWGAKERILSAEKPSEFSKMSDVSRQQTADVTRDAETMIKESGIFNKALTKKDDIGRVARFGNVSSTQQLIHRGPAGTLLKWVHSSINDIINQSVSIYKELDAYAKFYKDLPAKSRSKVMKAMIDFDGIANKELVDAGLQWATPEMLRSKGLSNSEILAYQNLTKGLDEAYRLNAETMRMDGKEPPPQIPGWFPHQWVGSYRVILRDATGTDFHMKAFQTRAAAQRYMDKAKFDYEARMEEPSAEIGSNDIAGVTIQALEVFKNKSKLDQVVLDKLNRLDKWSQQGLVRSMLERKADMGGHMAEDWQHSMFTDELNKKIQSAYIKYMEDTAKAWANSKIAKNIKEPLSAYREKMAETPNLQHAIDEHVARAVGKPVNHLKLIDETARAVSIYAGQDPNIVRNFTRQLNNFMVASKLLFPNTAFAFVNSFQALSGLDALMRIHMERSIARQPTGSVMKSTGVLLREWASFINQGKWSPEYASALKWLEKNNKLDNFQVDLLEASSLFKKTRDPVKFTKALETIEKHNKVASALSFYSYFREVMPPRQALEAAALHMDTVMGNYNPHQASAVFTDMGMVGKGMRPFHLLPMTIYGRMAMNLRLISDTVRGMKDKGYSAGDIGKSLAPFAAMLGTFYALAGAQGLPGWQEWDALARQFNSWVNPDNAMPRPAELARRMGMNTTDIYGLLGSTIGVNIGPSLNAPAVADIGTMPWLDAAHSAVQAGSFAYDMAKGEPNVETIYKAGRTALPPMITPWLEEYVASKNKGMYPASNSLTGEYKRTPEQQQITKIWGKRTIEEANQREMNSLDKYYAKVDQDWKNEQLDKLYQMVTKLNPTGDPMKFAKKMVDSKRGFDGDSIVDGLEERIVKGQTSAETRNKLKIANSTNAAEMARRKEIMDGLRTYFKANGH
jgi:hypothetical protein